MTRRAAFLLWSCTLLVCGGSISLSAAAWLHARDRAASARSQLDADRRSAREIATLRSAIPAWAISKGDALNTRPSGSKGGLAERINSVLASSGLPGSTLASLSADPESALAGEGPIKVTRQRAVLTLTPVTLPSLGRVLDEWRTREPAWTIATLDLSPASGGTVLQSRDASTPAPGITALESRATKSRVDRATASAITGTDLPLRVVLSIETLALSEPPSTPSPSSSAAAAPSPHSPSSPPSPSQPSSTPRPANLLGGRR